MRELTEVQRAALAKSRAELLEEIPPDSLENVAPHLLIDGSHRAGFVAGLECQQAALVAALRDLATEAEKALGILWTDNDSRGYGTAEEGEAAMQLRTAITAARAALAGVSSGGEL